MTFYAYIAMKKKTYDDKITDGNHPTQDVSSDNKISHIYDKLCKRILTLSVRSVLLLINALFGTEYPLDSTITYNWTEHHDDDLQRTIADTILTINGKHSYHMEAQIYKDEEIEFRVFDYGYKHALKHRNGGCTLTFPEARIIFLSCFEKLPENYTITLDFGTQGIFHFTVPALKLLEYTPEEVSQKNMIILLPFMLLKLRKDIEKARTPENLEALRTLIFDDIIGLINKNLEVRNITSADAKCLIEMIRKLYNHLYSHYEECKERGLNGMVEETFVLETDILMAEHKREVVALEARHKKEIDELNQRTGVMSAGYEKKIEELNREIERLKRQNK